VCHPRAGEEPGGAIKTGIRLGRESIYGELELGPALKRATIKLMPSASRLEAC
jgi:hypothetical protein